MSPRGHALGHAAGPGGNGDRVPALVARGIGVSFGGLRALDRVDIEVAAGSIVGVIGPNGAGKTTLFDCLSGFVPCEGKAWVGGTEITALPPHRRAAAGLGRSFQDARLFHTMTVQDTLRVASELHMRGAGVLASLFSLPRSRSAETQALARAQEFVELLGLGAYRDKLIRELSTGTRRIVDLGCVLAQNPAAVMLDEPSSGIAQRETEALGPLLKRLRDRTGCAMLVIEHDMPLLLGLAERVYALETGRVIAVGGPLEVVNHPEVVLSYLGADPTAIQRSGSAVEEQAPQQTATRRKNQPRKKAAPGGKPVPGAKAAGRAKPAESKPARRTKPPATRKRARSAQAPPKGSRPRAGGE